MMAFKTVKYENECPDYKVVNLQKIWMRKCVSCQALPLPVLIFINEIILFQCSLQKKIQDKALVDMIANFQSHNPGINYYKYTKVN